MSAGCLALCPSQGLFAAVCRIRRFRLAGRTGRPRSAWVSIEEQAVRIIDRSQRHVYVSVHCTRPQAIYVQQIWNDFHDVLEQRYGPGMQRLAGDLAVPATPATKAASTEGRLNR